MGNKVLLISIEFPPKCGGAGTVIFNVANRLGAKYQVEVLTLKGAIESKNNTYKLHEVKYIKKLFPILFAIKMRALDLNKYDVIVLNDIGAALIGTARFYRTFRYKTVVMIHGSEVEKISVSPSKLYQLVGFKSKYISLLNECMRVVCVSDYLKSKIMDGFSEVDENKISVIHNFVDETLFYPEKCSLHEKYNIPKKNRLLLYSGRIVREKGLEEVLDVLEKLIDSGHEYYWLVAGTGDFLDDLKNKVIEKNLEMRVMFLGNQTQEQLRVLYSSVDVLIMLSRYKEAFSISCLEAICCDTPVIARDIGGVREAVENGVTGFLVNNADECYEELVKERYLQLSVLKDGQARIRKYIEEQEAFDEIVMSVK